MEKFKIRQDGFKEIRKAMLMRAIPTSLVEVSAGIAINYFSFKGQANMVNTLPFAIPITLAALAFGLYRGVKRQKEIFDSYVLSVDPTVITREQHNTPKIIIPYSQLSEIIKNPKGGFMIKGNSIVNTIIVPAQIDNYEKLEELLSGIKQISTKNGVPLLQKYSSLISILTIGLMLTVYISQNKIAVGISGTVLLLLMGYSFFEIQRSKNIDSKTKRAVWLLILVTASIVGVMYFKLKA